MIHFKNEQQELVTVETVSQYLFNHWVTCVDSHVLQNARGREEGGFDSRSAYSSEFLSCHMLAERWNIGLIGEVNCCCFHCVRQQWTWILPSPASLKARCTPMASSSGRIAIHGEARGGPSALFCPLCELCTAVLMSTWPQGWKLGQGGAGRGRKWADFRFQSRGACFISSRNFDFQENIYMWSMYWHCAHITNMFRKWLRFYFTSVVCFVKGYHHCSLRGPKW